MGGMLIAIYSLNINIISKGKGKSAVAAAAYRAGEKITNEHDGEIHDYTKKKGIIATEIQLPENAPEEFYDRAVLWNSVEKSERAKNAQLCREIRLALPNEFDADQNEYLVHEYVRQNFVSRGMCADIALHDKGDGNPHAHILLTMRPIEKDGSWGAKSKMEYILDEDGERQKLPSGRYKTRKINTTDWDSRDNAELWRKNWADILNKHLEHFSHETRVDHRSYERQGLDQIPTIHLGVTAHQMEQKGIATERGDINRKIKYANSHLRNIDRDIAESEAVKSELLILAQQEEANVLPPDPPQELPPPTQPQSQQATQEKPTSPTPTAPKQSTPQSTIQKTQKPSQPKPTTPKPTTPKQTRPQLIIDLENSIKAKDSPAYENWARMFNLRTCVQ